MPRVEIKVNENILKLWDNLAEKMDINRSTLIKVAMSQYVRHNRMLLKLDIKEDSETMKDYEKQLKQLKVDAEDLKIVKIPKREVI